MGLTRLLNKLHTANMISRQQAFDLYDGSAVRLAQALGYKSRHAVYMWSKEEPIPEAAYLKLRFVLKPEAFDAKGRVILARKRRRKPTPKRALTLPHKAVGKGRARCG